ncbi:uncharacterized protein V6R79_021907 [Siganus canaliculatus]
MDASGAPVTDELTGVHHGSLRETLFMSRKRQPDAKHSTPPPPPPPPPSPPSPGPPLETHITSAQLYPTQQNCLEAEKLH